MRTKTQLAQEGLDRLRTWPDDAVKKLIVGKLKPLADRARRLRHTATATPPDSWQTVRRKLDRVFSEYIRLRDANEQGICHCISCGRPVEWKYMDCGHFMRRELLATRWEPKNCAAQCRSCNRYQEGARMGFSRGLDKKFGAGTAQTMEVRSRMSGADLRVKAGALLVVWTAELEKMRKDKNL